MGFFSWLFRLFGGRPSPHPSTDQDNRPSPTTQEAIPTERMRPASRGRVKLVPSRSHELVERGLKRHRERLANRQTDYIETDGASPYRFARFGSRTGSYLDLSRDGDDATLRERGLPVFHTPEQLADWLQLPLNKLAWLVHRFSAGRAASVDKSHYHYTWHKKRSGGVRLIESPKQTLKQVQVRILREILDKVPAHRTAHGFVAGRSILTNAKPHTGQAIVVKFDLKDFYATVGFSRVVAIFRELGYSRESAIWLSLLTTTAVPMNIPFDREKLYSLTPYWRRHLPQGAPTSPALANLSAYHLDARLTGMAKSYHCKYTRYADDLTISGPSDVNGSLPALIQLVEQIIRRERFHSNKAKRQVLRGHQRQAIAGVVVNAHPNVARRDYDRLKATLTNCVRSGPSSQNRNSVDDFAAHLRGRIAHVQQLNPARGEKLLAIYQQINWRR